HSTGAHSTGAHRLFGAPGPAGSPGGTGSQEALGAQGPRTPAGGFRPPGEQPDQGTGGTGPWAAASGTGAWPAAAPPFGDAGYPGDPASGPRPAWSGDGDHPEDPDQSSTGVL